MSQWVQISFDCLPLRSVGRLDVPIDASPGYRALCERIKQAIERHGTHNAYYLYQARAVYHLTNHDEVGMLEFRFEGTVLTDAEDRHARHGDLQIDLVRETCPWLTEPIVDWFKLTVTQAVQVEFDRYIEAGDLAQAKKRMEAIQARIEESGGYLGMYL